MKDKKTLIIIVATIVTIAVLVGAIFMSSDKNKNNQNT